MRREERGQISTEYLIIFGFMAFIIVGILGAGLIYSAQIRDKAKFNQIENFANKIIQSAESVFYAGKPSLITITLYLPAGVKTISVQGKEIIFEVSTASGINKIVYSSKVPLEGTISPSEGVKRLQLKAEDDKVTITQI